MSRFIPGRWSEHSEYYVPHPLSAHTHPKHTDPEFDAKMQRKAHDNLWVITAISNPTRFKSRYALYRKFRHHITRDLQLNLITVECSFAGRDHQISSIDLEDAHCENQYLDNGVRTINVRVKNTSFIWLKENLWNIGLRYIPNSCEYVLFADADIEFTHPFFVTELIHSLQEYMVVQPFETACDLGPDGQVIGVHRSFGYCHADGWEWKPKRNADGGFYIEKPKNKQGPEGFGIPFHPGFAMAFRRYVLDKMQLLEVGALGAGDHHMCAGLIGRANLSFPNKIHANYKKIVLKWEKRAKEVVNGSFGYTKGTILHDFHGAKKNRKYVSRWEILIENDFDPEKDVYKNCQGVFEIERKNSKLHDDIRAYFKSRNEDSVDIS